MTEHEIDMYIAIAISTLIGLAGGLVLACELGWCPP